MPSVISGDANVSAAEFGYLDGVTSALQTQIDSKLNLAGGKILQIVRATDSTDRTTTSSTYVDASISVTITPQKSDSALLIIWSFNGRNGTAGAGCDFQISDNSNNSVSGAQQSSLFSSNATNLTTTITLIAYSTPATTSATTYKGRFRVSSGTASIFNSSHITGQMYAIEVSA